MAIGEFNFEEYCTVEEDDTTPQTMSQIDGEIHPVGASHSGPANSGTEGYKLAQAAQSGGGTTGGEPSRSPTKRAVEGWGGGEEWRKRQQKTNSYGCILSKLHKRSRRGDCHHPSGGISLPLHQDVK